MHTATTEDAVQYVKRSFEAYGIVEAWMASYRQKSTGWRKKISV
jgi:hypothetical protein